MSEKRTEIDSEQPAHRELNESNTRFTGLVARILLAGNLGLLVLTGFDPRVRVGEIAPINVSFGLTLALVLLLVRLERARLGAWLMASGLLAVLVAVLVIGGITPGTASALLVVLIVAAATLGRAATLVFAGLAAASVAALTLLGELGQLPEPTLVDSKLSSAISISVTLLTTAALLSVLLQAHADATRSALDAARERDAARIRYLQAQKMEPVGRMASGIAHDFNNLLAVIRGVSEILRVRGQDRALAARLLDDLDNATTRASLMTSRLLAFTKGRPEELAVLDILQVAESITPLLARLLGDDIRVELDAPSERLWIRADRAQLEQAFLNLAVNARDAMPSGGVFSMRLTRARDESVSVVVEDTGVGMDAETVERAFTPFFTTKETGTGLGLATVRDIVEGGGGSILVQSGQGQGTRFTLRFAPAPSPPIEDPNPVSSTPDKMKGRVLLVEDHDLVRRVNARLLEGMGFEVTAVRDGVEALGLLDGGSRFEVVVSDWMMPRMDGVELALELERRCLRVPLVLISGNSDAGPPAFDTLSFPTTFLAKPFEPGDLGAAVIQVIRAQTRSSPALEASR